MKNTKLKKEKGITLVVLVITIVVLLILAAVVIVTLQGRDNVIEKAQKSKEDYSQASSNEELTLGSYFGKTWKELGLKVPDSVYGVEYSGEGVGGGEVGGQRATFGLKLGSRDITLNIPGAGYVSFEMSDFEFTVGEKSISWTYGNGEFKFDCTYTAGNDTWSLVYTQFQKDDKTTMRNSFDVPELSR